MKRLAAIRIFPYELDNSKVVIKKQEDRYTQTFLLTPLGAMVNRVYLVGTILLKEGGEKEGYTLRVSTPGASFFVRTGLFYSEEIRNKIEELEEGDFVAIVGKIRIFQPAGSERIFVYIRPENLEKSSPTTLKYWIYDAARWTLMRIRALQTALGTENPTVESLTKFGIDRQIAEGTIMALEKYGKDNINIEKYISLVELALQYVIPSAVTEDTEEKLERMESEEELESESEDITVESSYEKIPPEDKVLSLISSCDHDGGAKYEDILAVAEEEGLSKEELDRILVSLLEKGFIKEYKGRYQLV